MYYGYCTNDIKLKDLSLYKYLTYETNYMMWFQIWKSRVSTENLLVIKKKYNNNIFVLNPDYV